MRLVHLSDLHLGFRAFAADERGWNVRERDVSSVFQRAIQEAARLAPDLVLISGDLFHRPDPPSTAFLSLTRGVRTFQSLRPDVPILAIAGERDTPSNPADPGPVAVLDALSGVEAAAGAARAVRFRSRGLHVLLVPHRAAREPPFPDLRPDREARWNVLMVRGHPDLTLPGVALDPEEWDYVAVGGSHRARPFRPHVRAAGSLERIGWDPWREATEEKGFVVFDLEEGEGELHPVAGRPVVDLAPVRASRGDPAAATRRLRHLLEAIPGGIGGKILRVRIQGDVQVPEEGVEAGLLEGLRSRAAHLDIRLAGESGVSGEADARWSWVPRLPGEAGSERPREALSPGIHLLTAPSGSALERVLARWGPEADEMDKEGGASGGEIRLQQALWAGGEPAFLFRAGLRVLADGRRGEEAQNPGGPAGGSEAPPADRVGRLEEALRDYRADVVEAEGEVEARTLEWARDRQEAETRLQGYRDRARELRDRLRALEEGESDCPTCGQTLGERRGALAGALKEEWEMVVQDGRWWKRRREQLDEKPGDLRELEERFLRMRSELEGLVERLERVRSEPEPSPGPPAPEEVSGKGPLAPEDRGVVRGLLRLAGSHLRQWSEGRLSGLSWSEDGSPRVVERGVERPPTPLEESGVRLALHLALWLEIYRRGGALPAGLLVSALDERGLDPLLPLLEGFPTDEIALVAVLPPTAPDPGLPGVRMLVASEGGRKGQSLRWLPAGPAGIRLGPETSR